MKIVDDRSPVIKRIPHQFLEVGEYFFFSSNEEVKNLKQKVSTTHYMYVEARKPLCTFVQGDNVIRVDVEIHIVG